MGNFFVLTNLVVQDPHR